MENIFDTYKQIVDKAIDLGLLSEENKSFYLSAINGNATLDNYNSLNKSSCRWNKNRCIFSQPGNTTDSSVPTKCNMEQMSKLPNMCNKQEESVGNNPSDGRRSIENYSILNIKQPTQESCSTDSESSEQFYFLKRGASKIPGSAPHTMGAMTVKKKPKKNEVVDFRIPIYLDIKKKRKTRSSRSRRRRQLKKDTDNCSLVDIIEEMGEARTHNCRTFDLSTSSRCNRSLKQRKETTPLYSKDELLYNAGKSSKNSKIFQRIVKGKSSRRNADGKSFQRIFSTRSYQSTLSNNDINNNNHGLDEDKQTIHLPNELTKTDLADSEFTKKTFFSDIKILPKDEVFSDRKNTLNLRPETEEQMRDHYISPEENELSEIVNKHEYSSHTKDNFVNDDPIEERVINNSIYYSSKPLSKIEIKTSEEKEKLLNVNIYCQLLPTLDATIADKIPRENFERDFGSQMKHTQTSPLRSSTTEKKIGQLKEKKQNRKPAVRFLSKMFSRMQILSKEK